MPHSPAAMTVIPAAPVDLDRELALARFQSEGDPVMQCRHAISLFSVCHACAVASVAPAPRTAA